MIREERCQACHVCSMPGKTEVGSGRQDNSLTQARGGEMPGKAALLTIAAFCLFIAGVRVAPETKATDAGTKPLATPADGYTVHVTAPHLVDGHIMGPYHHYCKVMAPDPQIVCLIYDSDDPNAMLTQIEFIMAKKLTRTSVGLTDWNRLWHDHAVEIATGRVKVLDLPPDKAKEVADLVATTDGIIYNFQFNGILPNGKVTMAQAVGHKPLTQTEYEETKKQQ
jgi:hypothetical protein